MGKFVCSLALVRGSTFTLGCAAAHREVDSHQECTTGEGAEKRAW